MKAMTPIPFCRSVHVLTFFSNLTLLMQKLGVYLSGKSLAHHV